MNERVTIISNQIIGEEFKFYWITAGHLDYNYPDTLRTSKPRFIFLDFKKIRFAAVFLYDSCEDLALCFPVTVNVIRRRDNAISTHQKKTHYLFASRRQNSLKLCKY